MKLNIKLSKKTARILYWSIIAVLALTIIVCAAMIVTKVVTDAQNEDEWNDIRGMVQEAPTTPTLKLDIDEPSEPLDVDSQPGETQPTEPTTPHNIDDTVLFKYQALYEMNRDMVGWIKIEGTAIDYPVVQTPTKPNFYLRRNFYKETATCGTIYVREACNVNMPSDNVTVYGHNMRNGTMFADLHKFKNKSFWEEHRYVRFDTLHEERTYEIFSVFRTTADLTKGFTYHIYDTFATEAAFNEFVSTCKNIDFYETGVKPAFGDKLLTLSTCDKSIEEGRLVVVCRRIS